MRYGTLSFQPQPDEIFRDAKHFVDVGEDGGRIVVVVHRAVLVVLAGRYLFDDEAHFLERRGARSSDPPRLLGIWLAFAIGKVLVNTPIVTFSLRLDMRLEFGDWS